MELDYAIKPRRRPKVNVRLVLFILVIAAPFAWFSFAFVQDAISGGIENHGSYASVNLKALGQFPFDQENGGITDVPRKYRELDGKRVELQGFMYAGMSAGQTVSRCQLVWNVQKCCFGGPPQVQERVFLEAPGNKRLPLYDVSILVRVIGKLHVRIQKNETGTVTTVYKMVPDTITPVS